MGGDADIERKGPTRRTPEGKMTQYRDYSC